MVAALGDVLHLNLDAFGRSPRHGIDENDLAVALIDASIGRYECGLEIR